MVWDAQIEAFADKIRSQFLKGLIMDQPIVENTPTPRENLLQNWRASQQPYGKQIKKSMSFDQNRSNGPRAPICLSGLCLV